MGAKVVRSGSPLEVGVVAKSEAFVVPLNLENIENNNTKNPD